jgi:hypothetical protein
MRDSTTAADIPLAGLSIAAGYGNGLYAWSAADYARFANAGIQTVRIDVSATSPGSCSILDVEKGDATPDGAPGWAKQRHSLTGDMPLIYVNRSNVTAVFNAMNAAGMQIVRDFKIWVATLDGVTRTIPDMTGVVAVQWKRETANSGSGHYDESIVYDDTWHPVKPPVPPAKREYIVVDPVTVNAIKVQSGWIAP